MLQKKFEVDTKKIGLRTADMLIKVTKGQIENVASEIAKLHSKSVLEISIRIGQLDFNLVVKVVYKDSDEIYDIIKTVNTFDYVESVQWSEIVRIILRKENGLVENLLELSK
jgi:DNA-binding Lrp family transcriptional regulator